jgi:nucleotide-binding universal stress UspA family protein
MGGYSTIVVGTDGSDSSLRAVERAARLAGDAGAKLVLACAYKHPEADAVGDAEIGDHAIGAETIHSATERAVAAGATDIDSFVLPGRPAAVIADVVAQVKADLVVVGNRGLSGLAGRLVGSVPLEVARGVGVDVLIVHTV